MLKEKPVIFSDKLDMGYERKKRIENDSKHFVLDNWQDGTVIAQDGRDGRCSTLGECTSSNVSLEMSIRHPRGDAQSQLNI